MKPHEFAGKIALWHNSSVTLWSYGVSLSELQIRLQKDGVRGNLHVVCNGVSSIRSPAFWRLGFLEMIGLSDDHIQLTDASVQFSVECKMVRFMADVDPIF